jgi:xanthine dehydrogenase molybdenum-binding subunit
MAVDALSFTVNGEVVSLTVEADEMLSDVLRNRLGLTGTKIACQEDECGACTVLLDGEPVLSCNFPALKAAGRHVRTIEGLAKDGVLHPLQESFVRHGAVQCGFCIPGQLMTAVALLERSPSPNEEEIRHALKDTLCRCAGYPTILRAIQDAAGSMRTGAPLSGPPVGGSDDLAVIGRVVPRPDAIDKVTGAARYADDLAFPGMLHAAVLRAGEPHAILRGLDVEGARSSPGVRAVLTAADLPGERNHGLVILDWPVMVGVGETVRTVGDALAIVAADTRSQAQDALAKIHAALDPLPVVSDPVQAARPGATHVHPAGNLLKHIKVRKGEVERGFAESEIVFEQTYHTPVTEHAFLEPECSIARPLPGGRIEVYVGSQIPYADREQIAACLGLAQDAVRVIGTPIGGGFGGKEDIAGQIHAALLARITGAPVKLLFDRHESLLVHPKRHATQIRVRLGVRHGGTIHAAQTELYGDTGAYASLGEKVMTRATTHSTGPYIIPHVRADCYAMYTNNPPAGAFRGFGVTQSAFAIESALDEVAHRLGLDPIELRRRNALRVGAETNTGQRLDESVGLLECLDRVEQELRGRQPEGAWNAARAVHGRPHLRRAWGLAAAFKNTGLGGGAPDKAEAEVEILPDGTLEVRTSSAEIGQGLLTVLQMIAAEELLLPVGQVRVLLSDTDLTPDGGPTTASRQTFVAGNAVRGASYALRQAITSCISERLDVPPARIRYVEGLAQIEERTLTMAEIGRMMRAEGRAPRARHEYWAPETQPLGTGGRMHVAYGFAVQAAEVDVDLETGEVKVLRVIAATDVGRALNPLGLLGQIEGGVMMGIGTALTEEFILEQGRVFTDRLARYRMPSIVHAPEIIPVIVESPAAEGPYGAKGVGEITSIPTAPAITNAIFHACGVRVRRLPVDQDQLALEIAARREAKHG